MRVSRHIAHDLEASGRSVRTFRGKPTEAEIFHHLVGLAEEVLGTGGPPVPFDAPFYEVGTPYEPTPLSDCPLCRGDEFPDDAILPHPRGETHWPNGQAIHYDDKAEGRKPERARPQQTQTNPKMVGDLVKMHGDALALARRIERMIERTQPDAP